MTADRQTNNRVERPLATWVVLPTYNEAENLAQIVSAISQHLGTEDRILVVDDHSPDGTGQIAARLAAENSAVEIIHRPGKFGLGAAYIAGFDRALAQGAELIIQMDADFSHNPDDLPALLAAAGSADLVLGSRYLPGGGVSDWGIYRRALSRSGNLYSRMILGLKQKDLTGGFKCWRAETLRAVDYHSVRSSGYAFQVEITYRAVQAGQRVTEIPIIFRERTRGKSKMSAAIALEALIRIPALRLTSVRQTGR